MRLVTAFITVLGALAVGTGCLDSGGSGGGVSQPGEQASLFDDFFGGAGARESGDTNNAAQGGTSGTPNVPCEGGDCPPAPSPGEVSVIDAAVCELPHAPPTGAASACSTFCARIAGCAGQPDAASACTSDCASTLGGIEIASAQAIFGCYTSASCDDIARYRGGGVSTTDGPGDDRVPPPTEPSPAPMPSGDGGGSDDGGSSSNFGDSDSADPDDGGSAYTPEGGSGGVIVDSVNPIDTCLEAVAQAWTVDALPSAKLAVCHAAVDAEDTCDGGTVSVNTTPGEAPASGSGDGGGDSSSGGDSGGPYAPSGDGGAPQQDPAPPVDPDDGDDDGDAIEVCARVAHILTQGALNRVAACDALTDCDARDACLEGELACLPFITSLIGGSFSDGGTATTVNVSEGSATPNEAHPESPPSAP